VVADHFEDAARFLPEILRYVRRAPEASAPDARATHLKVAGPGSREPLTGLALINRIWLTCVPA
jgi:hypothetical protein